MLRRNVTINRDLERQILISLITSKQVLQVVESILDPQLFETMVGRKVAKWIRDYYLAYKDAPKRLIQNIFEQERPRLKPEEEDNLEAFLQSLSDEYMDSPANETFMSNEAIEYLKRRRLAAIAREVEGIVTSNGRLQDAEAVLSSYNRTMGEVATWVNPLDEDYMHDVFSRQETPLFTLPGDFGELIGPLRRGFLMGIMGPMKRGKTWWLLEMAFQAITSRRRVAFISLEMEKEDVANRFYRRLTSFADEDKQPVITVFDCVHNQQNMCNINGRSCRCAIGMQGYIPCTKCKGTSEFEQTFYQSGFEPTKFEPYTTGRELRKFIRMYGANHFKLISYPPFTANLKTILTDMEILFYNNYLPDVIILDYADILAPEQFRGDFRHQVDDTWKTLKRMAAERKVVVITATQGNRATLQKEIIEQTDISEDIRKLAHVDIMVALSQTRRERANNTMRLNILGHRWKEFDPYRVMGVTYNFDLGQPLLDSHLHRFEPSEEDNG